jgi:hypothetical protein
MNHDNNMDELQRFRRRRRLQWFTPLLLMGLFAALLLWTSFKYPLNAFPILALWLGPAILVGLLTMSIEFAFSRLPRVRQLLKWAMLLTTLTLGIATYVSREWPWRWEYGYPGNGIEFGFSWGVLELEIDFSHEIRHMMLHGAPGYTHLTLPFFLLLLVTTPLTVILWAHPLSRRPRWLDRRYSDGCCPSCGYNLTANVSGICPECGKPVPQAEPQPPPDA